MFLLTVSILKNNNIFAATYFIFQYKGSTKNLNVFRYRLWTSVKKSVNLLWSKTIFSFFFYNLVALILRWNCVKRLIVTKIVQKINFDEDLSELEAKHCFQRQSLTKFRMRNLVFMWNSAVRKKFNFYFSAVSY